jgi:pimeloyl-ACP methyl ester carboxylesterase
LNILLHVSGGLEFSFREWRHGPGNRLEQPYSMKTDMSNYTHQTAPTQFLEANGVRFAYRRFGKQEGLPLVFIPHILGNLDSWDPSVTDGFAQNREVILFNNAGIASSSGEVPTTFAEMAKSAGVFLDALGIINADLLGFSIGSMIAQNVALERPELLRKLILVGSGPRNGDGIPLTPESQAIFTNKYGNLDDFWIDGFFTASPESQAAGRAFLKRRDARVVDRDIPISEEVQPAQFAALQDWGKPVGERFAYLKNIKIPVLIVGGKSDIIFYTINSFYLEQNLPNAQLIVYPDAAHGSLFQYPSLFVEHTNMFLRG